MEAKLKKAIFLDMANELTYLGNNLDAFTRRLYSVSKPVAEENESLNKRLELFGLYLQRLRQAVLSAADSIIHCDSSDDSAVSAIRFVCDEVFRKPGFVSGRPVVGDNETLWLSQKK